MLPPHVRSEFARHVESCGSCKERSTRALQLQQLRRRGAQRGPGAGQDTSTRVISYASLLSPMGLLWIAAGPRGVVRIASDEDEGTFCNTVDLGGFGVPAYVPDALARYVEQIEEYFKGSRTSFQIPLDLSRLGTFQRAVLEAVLAVPYGVVCSYRDIAVATGRPLAARAVGTALASNPISLVIPCHRIIRSDGTPGEYGSRGFRACGVQLKLMLLALEGVTFGD